MREEFYTRPILAVQDVTASINYYCEKLGFTKVWSSPDEAPIIAQVDRNGMGIILDSASVIPRASNPSVLSMTLHQADQLGALYRELKNNGAKITATPFPVVWDEKLYQFDVEDLDGNILVFWGDAPDSLHSVSE